MIASVTDWFFGICFLCKGKYLIEMMGSYSVTNTFVLLLYRQGQIAAHAPL